jgi:hypothetical protein
MAARSDQAEPLQPVLREADRRKRLQMLRREGFVPAGIMALADDDIGLQGDLPRVSGIYLFLVDDFDIGYVGAAQNLEHRVWSHCTPLTASIPIRRSRGCPSISANSSRLVATSLSGSARMSRSVRIPVASSTGRSVWSRTSLRDFSHTGMFLGSTECTRHSRMAPARQTPAAPERSEAQPHGKPGKQGDDDERSPSPLPMARGMTTTASGLSDGQWRIQC